MQLPVAELPEDEGHQQQLLMVDTRNNQHVELPVGYRGYILTDQGMELVQVQEEEVRTHCLNLKLSVFTQIINAAGSKMVTYSGTVLKLTQH